MKHLKYFIPALLIVICMLAGCGRNDRLKPGDPFIYYLNMEGTGIEKRAFDWSGETEEEEIQNILDALMEADESGKFRAAIPENVRIEQVVLEDRKIDIHFSNEYRRMDRAQEVLCRAAIVQSLVQIDGVELVKFYVEDEMLTDKDGIEIGYMNADEFVQNTGESLSSFQKVELVLYLPNKDGDALTRDVRNIRYNSNMSVEKVVVEQLMREPAVPNELVIMPPETKLLGVTVKDGICYVNFDDGFLTTGYLIDPQLSIYSIVNSIVDSGSASQVQISVNGKTDVIFQNSVDLSKPISRNWDVVEDEM